MGFFDLNIPYDTSKPNRAKLLVKLLELGYTALAYNHTIKGVMSDRDRCSIPLLSLSSLLNHIPPSLLSSIRLHRDALHIPHSSPFRQYTRLTVCVDSPTQCHLITSGNPILKTYDLVSVRPLSQLAFDHACEKCEVDIIAIDFSDKLPFRLKPQMVKAAVERGVYFEVTYSCIIADVQVRRQMISNAKVLVDWTRGKNLILSSAALSVNELRGPCDVANLSSLLGLSMERAKAAISKNCRNLITNALRRRHFYKEAIRIEEIPPEEKNSYDKHLSADWLKWDPISSGEGDLQLEDLARSFEDASKVSKPVKAIDFSSIIDSIPPQGKGLFSAIGTTEAPVTTFGFSKNPVQLGLLPHSNRNSICSGPSMNQNPVHGSSQEIQLRIDSINCSIPSTNTNEQKFKTLSSSSFLSPLPETEECELHSENHADIGESNNVLSNENAMGQMFNPSFDVSSVRIAEGEINFFPDNSNLTSQIERYTDLQDPDVILRVKDVIGEDIAELNMIDEDISITEDTSVEQLRTRDDSLVSYYPTLPDSDDKEIRDVSSVANDQTEDKMIIEKQEDAGANSVVIECKENSSTVVYHNPFSVTTNALKVKEVPSLENNASLVKMPIEKHGNDCNKFLVPDNDLQINSSSAYCMTTEMKTVNVRKHEGAVSKSEHAIIFPSKSGKPRSKRRTSRHTLAFPVRRSLYPFPFKRKAKKGQR